MLCKVDYAIQRIKIFAFAISGMNRHQLALKAGLTESATRHIHTDNWNPTLNTIRQLESVVPDDFAFEEMPEAFKPKNEPERKKKNDRKNSKR